MSDRQTAVAHALKTFVEGAKLRHLGAFVVSRNVQKAGWAKLKDGLKIIDEMSDSKRDVLIPLLQDPDPCVRVDAAQFLIESRRELAVPVLQDIYARCVIFEPKWSAHIVLMEAGVMEKPGVTSSK